MSELIAADTPPNAGPACMRAKMNGGAMAEPEEVALLSKAMSAPADEDIKVYAIKAEGDDLLVQVPG